MSKDRNSSQIGRNPNKDNDNKKSSVSKSFDQSQPKKKYMSKENANNTNNPCAVTLNQNEAGGKM